jgi:hypothetical protein
MVVSFPSSPGTGKAESRNSMKTKCKKEHRKSKRLIVMDYMVPDSPQSAFMALFAPIRDESWPNVTCSYLFTGNGEKETDRAHHL